MKERGTALFPYPHPEAPSKSSWGYLQILLLQYSGRGHHELPQGSLRQSPGWPPASTPAFLKSITMLAEALENINQITSLSCLKPISASHCLQSETQAPWQSRQDCPIPSCCFSSSIFCGLTTHPSSPPLTTMPPGLGLCTGSSQNTPHTTATSVAPSQLTNCSAERPSRTTPC